MDGLIDRHVQFSQFEGKLCPRINRRGFTFNGNLAEVGLPIRVQPLPLIKYHLTWGGSRSR